MTNRSYGMKPALQNNGFTPLEVRPTLRKYYGIARFRLAAFARKKTPVSKRLLTGFTLLEMIVAVGVFAVLASLSVGSLLMLTGAQKKAASLQSIQDNLRFALEAMSKDIRFGDQYYCSNNPEDPGFPLPFQLVGPIFPTDCALASGGGKLIAFQAIREGVSAGGPIVMYRLGGPTIGGLGGGPDSLCIKPCIEKAEGNYDVGGTPEFFPITSKDVDITNLIFYLTGAKGEDFEDTIETRTTVAINAEAQVGAEISEFFLQTSVSRLQEQRK